MKKQLFIGTLLCTLLLQGALAQREGFYMEDPAGYTFIPPCDYQIDSANVVSLMAYYLSTSEITNAQYKEFLDDLKSKNDTASLAVARIRNENWKDIPLDIVVSYASMGSLPVVNVSRQAAELYCKWLSDKLTLQYGYFIEVMLPTKAEWEWAAMGGDTNAVYPWTDKQVKKARGKPMARYNADGMSVGPCAADAYPENGFELYNMAGNVAEMIRDADIVKGGSWNSTLEDLNIKVDKPLEVSPMVGFRPRITYLGRFFNK
jgi:formylglycine-generating enzyme required for sulfatase activity